MKEQDKTNSKFQKKVNHLREVIADLQKAVSKRRQYSRNSNLFIKKLLAEGRTTTEELSQYFTKIK
jgi:hypothetical protein